ncbi:hypothetical protein SF83666_d69450 (plasmid) [Sinorhizobium fredii CCBAU 83666]|nr:hypothetical protein SF83666_d69450 [Sinorhizobium fredii CCBAU 83666]
MSKTKGVLFHPKRSKRAPYITLMPISKNRQNGQKPAR